MEKITYKQYDGIISRYVNKRLKEGLPTYTSAGVATYMNGWAECEFPAEKMIEMKEGWREHLKTIVPTEKELTN